MRAEHKHFFLFTRIFISVARKMQLCTSIPYEKIHIYVYKPLSLLIAIKQY